MYLQYLGIFEPTSPVPEKDQSRDMHVIQSTYSLYNKELERKRKN